MEPPVLVGHSWTNGQQLPSRPTSYTRFWLTSSGAPTLHTCFGIAFADANLDLLLFPNASLTGLGASLLDGEASGVWSSPVTSGAHYPSGTTSASSGASGGLVCRHASCLVHRASWCHKVSQAHPRGSADFLWAEDTAVTLLNRFVRGVTYMLADTLCRGLKLFLWNGCCTKKCAAACGASGVP